MKRTSFARAEYAGKKRQTRRERFLAEMNTVVPWARLEALIEPHHPKSGKVGRPPIGVPRMLRMYFLQQRYTLADEALEDALYDSQERQLHGDSGYTGLDKRDAIQTAQDDDRLHKGIDWRIAIKRGVLKAMPEGPLKAMYEWFERRKAQVRAIVEHPFHIIKNLFGYRKVSYRGLAKNAARAKVQAALVNLYIAKRRLMAQGISASAAAASS